jgi:type I restriction enzyme, S subunit
MSRYQAYPEYRESGVQWLDNLPKHWGVKRTKKMFSLTRELVGKNSSEYQLLSLTLRGVIHRDISDGSGKIPAEFDTYQVVRPDNLIFCLFDIEETPRTVGLSTDHGMITGAYNVYICSDECHPKYAYYYFMHIDSFKGLQPFYTGLRKVVRAETFANIEMPAPSISEQWQITKFLDHETAKIDALIEKQRRLIELLKEKRQAVISHAVTKGLNPNAPMKDSGVEWLGEVPAHWEMTKFHYEIDLLEGPGILANDFHDEGVPLLRIQNVKDEFVSSDYKTYLSPSKVRAKWDHFRVAQGDLIISCSATTGLVSEVAENTAGAVPYTGLIRLRPQVKASITKEFIRCLVQSDLFFEQIKLLQSGSTIQHFGPYHLQQMHITLPTITEQDEIAKTVKEKTVRLDKLISIADQQIELMQERRSALISAAVTGKIDVRDWQVAA